MVEVFFPKQYKLQTTGSHTVQSNFMPPGSALLPGNESNLCNKQRSVLSSFSTKNVYCVFNETNSILLFTGGDNATLKNGSSYYIKVPEVRNSQEGGVQTGFRILTQATVKQTAGGRIDFRNDVDYSSVGTGPYIYGTFDSGVTSVAFSKRSAKTTTTVTLVLGYTQTLAIGEKLIFLFEKYEHRNAFIISENSTCAFGMDGAGPNLTLTVVNTTLQRHQKCTVTLGGVKTPVVVGMAKVLVSVPVANDGVTQTPYALGPVNVTVAVYKIEGKFSLRPSASSSLTLAKLNSMKGNISHYLAKAMGIDTSTTKIKEIYTVDLTLTT